MKSILIPVLAMLVLGVAGSIHADDQSPFNTLMGDYEPIRLALMQDSIDGVPEHGAGILATLQALSDEFSCGAAGIRDEDRVTVEEQLPAMIESAHNPANSATLTEARLAFYELSKPLVRWRGVLISTERPFVAYCPMHKKSWLQPDRTIGNPYGNMPRCGSIVSSDS